MFRGLTQHLRQRARRVEVCIIGGGPAGAAAALRAVDFGRSACIVERTRIGGADLWDGSLQSKTMWEMSKFCRLCRGSTGNRFLDVDEVALGQVDSHHLREAMRKASETREAQIAAQLKASNVDMVWGHGAFNGPRELVVQQHGGDTLTIKADYFIICTGSTPKSLPQYPTDGKRIISSDHILRQDLPKSLVVIGAGVIGCEFASILANFGQTDVHVIDKTHRILPNEDNDVGTFIERLLQKKGVHFHHRCVLERLEPEGDHVKVTIRHGDPQPSGQQLSSFTVERALVSIGRRPNYENLGLESLPGVSVKLQEGLVCDEHRRVAPFDHIYVAGDALASTLALVNVAELEARSCVEHIYSPTPLMHGRGSYDNLSTIFFLDQEVASVGRNERQCRADRIAYRVARYGFEFVSRAIAMNNTNGFIKLIVTNNREQRVLGVRAVGPHASSVVELASLAIHNRQSAYELAELMTAYPAITQGFQECLRMLLGTSVLKPNVFPELVVSEWSPDFSRGRCPPPPEA